MSCIFWKGGYIIPVRTHYTWAPTEWGFYKTQLGENLLSPQYPTAAQQVQHIALLTILIMEDLGVLLDFAYL